MSRYGIFFTGVASTPTTVGLMDWNSGEKITEINCRGKRGEEIRGHYDRIVRKLEKAYSSVLNPKDNNRIFIL
jgi:hypothetical protein